MGRYMTNNRNRGCREKEREKECERERERECECERERECKCERERECERENEQRHVHEVEGSVFIAEPEDPHNHRFTTVTGEAIQCGPNDHVHEVKFMTDFYEDHFHEFCGKTGGAIKVGDRHVHFLKDCTTVRDGHKHEFRFNTFIDNPIGEESKQTKCNKRFDSKYDME